MSLYASILGSIFHLQLHQTPSESTGQHRKPIIPILHLCRKHVMPISQAGLVPPDLFDDGMLPRAEDTLGVRVGQASLMVRVLAHEVHSGEVKLSIARSTAGDLECLGYRGVR